jgi:hypothetical protein
MSVTISTELPSTLTSHPPYYYSGGLVGNGLGS